MSSRRIAQAVLSVICAITHANCRELFCAPVCCAAIHSIFIRFTKGLCNLTYRLGCHDQSSHVSSSPCCAGGGNSLISPPVKFLSLRSPLPCQNSTICFSSIAPDQAGSWAVWLCGTTPAFRPSKQHDAILGHSDDDHAANSC